MDISVIIPIYNTKEYMEKCIGSVLDQEGVDYEIILVDDGSTDGSAQLCDRYENDYECIKAIHKANAGLGYARNSGLDVACGKYIFFLDSDDWIAEGALSRLLCLAREFQVDLVSFQYVQTAERECAVPKEKGHGRLMDNRALMRAYYYDEISTSAWSALYDKKIFADLRFTNVALHEDAYSKHLFLERAETAYVTDEIFYVQYIRKGSLIQASFSEANMISIECGERLVTFAREKYPELTGRAYRIKIKREKDLIDYYILPAGGVVKNNQKYHEILDIMAKDLGAAVQIEETDKDLYGQVQRMISHPYFYAAVYTMRKIKDRCGWYFSVAYRKLIRRR